MKANKILSFTLGSVVAVSAIFTGFQMFGNGAKYTPRFASAGEEENEAGIKSALKYYFDLRKNGATGLIDETYMQQVQIEAMAAFNQRAGGLNYNWEEMGPNNIGGRTRGLIFDLSDATYKTIYAGAVGGGLWKTTNLGGVWTQIQLPNGTGIPCLNVSAVAQDSLTKDIYVGTGEGLYYQSGDGTGGLIGQGIWVSRGASGTFTRLEAGTAPTSAQAWSLGTYNFSQVNSIAVDPLNSQKVYAATNKGLMTSSDAGVSWVKETTTGNQQGKKVEIMRDGTVFFATNDKVYRKLSSATVFVNIALAANGFAPNAGRTEVAVSQKDNNYVYAACSNSAGGILNIYKSIDKGDNWTVIGAGSPSSTGFFSSLKPYSFLTALTTGDNSGQGDYDNILKVSPLNKDVLFLGGTTLWKWTLTTGWNNISEYFGAPGGLYTVHPDQHAIAYHPTDPNVVYYGNDGGIFKSIDGGVTFKQSNYSYNVSQYYSVAFDKSGSFIIGGLQDNGTVGIITSSITDPKYGIKLNGGDGGYTEISLLNPQATFGGTPPEDGDLFRTTTYGGQGASYLSGRLKSEYANNASFFVTPIALWESFDNPHPIDTTISVYVGDTMAAVTNTNLPPNYITIKGLIPTLDYIDSTRNQVLPGQVFKRVDNHRANFAVATNSSVWFTPNILDFTVEPSFIKIAKSSSSTGPDGLNDAFTGVGKCMAWSSDGDILYVGTLAGGLFRISNISKIRNNKQNILNLSTSVADTAYYEVGAANSPISVKKIFSSLGGDAVCGVAVDKNNPDNVILTTGGYSGSTVKHIFRSITASTTTGTASFTQIQGNLPGFPIYSAVIDFQDKNKVILGTDIGVWSTDNAFSSASPTWAAEPGHPPVATFMVRQQQYAVNQGVANSGAIYTATHGRGVFKSLSAVTGIKDIEASADNTFVSKVTVFPNPMNDNASMVFKLKNKGNAIIYIYNLTGKLIVSKTLSNLTEGINKYDFESEGLSNGTYIVNIVSNNERLNTKFVVNK